MESNHIIQLNNVCFSYGSGMVLQDISMNIERNRICFIMGNNGSGKTTLLKNILGFLIPKSGSILINGAEIAKTDKRTISRMVSYVPQAIHLSADFTVLDYLSLGRTPHLSFISKLSHDDYRIIEYYAVKLGLDSILGASFNKLSGGQKQIVAITRSLIQDTPIIILDEPMSALDLGKQVDLLNVLKELESEGKTIILTTHNPNHALAIDCDVCFLKNGKNIAYGKNHDVIQEKMLHAVYGENIMLDTSGKHENVNFNINNNGDICGGDLTFRKSLL